MVHNKTRIVIIILALTAAMLSVGAAIAAHSPAPEPTPPDSTVSNLPDRTDEPSYKYIARAYEGKLAIYVAEQEQAPKYVTEILVSALPEADRAKIAQGIPIQNDEELIALLEDYDG